jgi:hypothetical protein
VSHHTLSALGRVALAPALVAVPELPPEQAEQVESALASAGVWRLHERASLPEAMVARPDLRGVQVTTMGRGPADDPAFFAAAFAAGSIAARIARGEAHIGQKPPGADEDAFA